MLKLRVYDLVEKTWLSDYHEVTYRNTLLGVLYPDGNFAVGDCYAMLAAKIPHDKIAAVLDAGFEDYKIIGASGSRKHGRVLYSNTHSDAFSKYFGSNANCINYGSNLTTECKKIQKIKINLLVVNDGEYGTGDCHGKCNWAFSVRFAGCWELAMQHRIVCESNSWVAKGTIIYSPEVQDSKYDLVLPVSSFKGNKVKPGKYKVEVIVGIVFTSPAKNERYEDDWRSANLSYSVVQFLPWKAVEKDILPVAKKKAAYLNKIASSPVGILSFLNYITEEGEIKDSDYDYSSLVKVLKSDIYSQLTTHPWIVSKVSEMLRKYWVKLATSGGIKFNYSMIMPDESLPVDACCIPSLPPGTQVIVFPYPCRWKHDIKVLQNVESEHWQDFQGIIGISSPTALSMGRDYDGDSLYWLPISEMPNVAEAIKAFPAPPAEAEKPPKNALQGTLGKIALMSMDNLTGLVTWLIAKASALGNEKIIYQLVPQLQAAVDSLKGATPPDAALIDKLGEQMKYQTVSWLKEHKDPNLFIKYPFSVTGRTDTVSCLVDEISKLWIPPAHKTSNKSSFLPLFGKPRQKYFDRACTISKEYNQAIGKALQPKFQYIVNKKPVPLSVEDKVSEDLSNILNYYRDTLSKKKCTPEQKLEAAAAFWYAYHWQNSEHSTSLCFTVALDEICLQLTKLRINEFTLVKPGTAYSETIWQGEHLIFRLVEDGQYVNAYDVDDQLVGGLPLSQYPPVLINVWCEGNIYTKFDSRNKACGIRVVISNDF